MLRFSLVKQRNGSKFTVKKVKVDKDYTFRDTIAALVLKVGLRKYSNFFHTVFAVCS